MKRCPECRRDYYDDSLLYCLDDGSALLEGPKSEPPALAGGQFDGEPQTAILSEPPAVAGGFTRSSDVDDSEPKTAILAVQSSVGREQQTGRIQPPATAGGSDRRKGSVWLLAAVGIAVLLLAGFFGYRYYNSPSKQIESIAVMPFVNDSGNADVEYLSDGITETLIGSLAKIANLSVKARSAVFAYKGKEISPKQVGDELGVQAVILGRFAQRGENIRIALELVNAKTLDVIWTEQYDRKQADLVNLQSEIARDVSAKLRSKLSGDDQQAVSKKYTSDPEAYRLYLQARFYLNKRVGKEYEKAQGFLQQAIERDPNFALAYTGLAEFIGQTDRPKAKEYITRALAIDNELSDGHALLGFQYTLDRDWNMAERELRKAIDLDPENWQALQWDGARQMFIGRYDESLRAFDRAVAIEPTMADLRNNRGACLVAAGRVDEGIASIKDGIRVDPSYAWSFSHLSFVYRMNGDRAASVEARAHTSELLDRPDLAKRLRDAFANGGWTAYLSELLAQQKENYASNTRRASILSELGEKEEAFATLEEAAARGDWWLFSIKYDPAFDPMHGDPRFQALLKQFEPPK